MSSLAVGDLGNQLGIFTLVEKDLPVEAGGGPEQAIRGVADGLTIPRMLLKTRGIIFFEDTAQALLSLISECPL